MGKLAVIKVLEPGFFFFNLAPAFLAVLGICCCMWGLSSYGDRGLLFVAWASHCGGFSCCGAQALEHEDFSGCGSQAQ